LSARSKYVVEIGRQDVKINVTDSLDAKEGQDHFVPDEYINENRSVFESSQLKSLDELEVRKFWNTTRIRLQDHVDQLVVLQLISSLSESSSVALNQLNWAHKYYARKGIVVLAVFSSSIATEEIEQLAMRDGWEMPLALSVHPIERDALHFLEPKLGQLLQTRQFQSHKAPILIRNKFVHKQLPMVDHFQIPAHRKARDQSKKR
jgi:hypothetical protein